jgi:ATPase subunit of ABC transporter with duplicated ATPase domains
MKILTGELTPTSGTVGISDGERLGVLRQDQFAFEDFRVVRHLRNVYHAK